jgi:hypothetical protein
MESVSLIAWGAASASTGVFIDDDQRGRASDISQTRRPAPGWQLADELLFTWILAEYEVAMVSGVA